MSAVIYFDFACIAVSIINVAIVLRALKKSEDQKKNDKVILKEIHKILNRKR
jgi:hypothetical protein